VRLAAGAHRHVVARDARVALVVADVTDDVRVQAGLLPQFLVRVLLRAQPVLQTALGERVLIAAEVALGLVDPQPPVGLADDHAGADPLGLGQLGLVHLGVRDRREVRQARRRPRPGLRDVGAHLAVDRVGQQLGGDAVLVAAVGLDQPRVAVRVLGPHRAGAAPGALADGQLLPGVARDAEHRGLRHRLLGAVGLVADRDARLGVVAARLRRVAGQVRVLGVHQHALAVEVRAARRALVRRAADLGRPAVGVRDEVLLALDRARRAPLGQPLLRRDS
jgi:hypothetical protein